MRVAVVGAGIMGASTALALAERGHEVTLLEQFGFLHDRGSSHGRSRIIRKAYPDAFYTAIMDEGYALWRRLQAFSDAPIVFEPGLLYYGKFESEALRDVITGLQQLDIEHELLDHEQVRRVFPELLLNAGEIGVFTPEAGWVDARGAIDASIRRLRDLGGNARDHCTVPIDRIAFEFDRYVICAGAWVREFLPLPVGVTIQTFGYVEMAKPVEGPVWIEDSALLLYGFPSEPGSSSVKIGVHQHGPEIDASNPDRPPTPEHVEAIREQATRRFGAHNAALTCTGCLYTSTANEDFLFGRHGDAGFFVSACSGHGFKFGPWIGRTMADFVEDRDAPENHPRFCWPVPLLEA